MAGVWFWETLACNTCRLLCEYHTNKHLLYESAVATVHKTRIYQVCPSGEGVSLELHNRMLHRSVSGFNTAGPGEEA